LKLVVPDPFQEWVGVLLWLTGLSNSQVVVVPFPYPPYLVEASFGS